MVSNPPSRIWERGGAEGSVVFKRNPPARVGVRERVLSGVRAKC
jgi:hypothetical protein